MIIPTESYLKVQYELRPAKQVERRMLIEALQMMSSVGFPISDYKYTGFGSIYFVDFILFHKLLGIQRMLSVEHSDNIKKRVKFNRPFDCIDVEFGPIGDFLPSLSPDQKHILWLDYDDILNRSQVEDILLATTYLSTGSILLVTVDVEPPGKNEGPEEWRDHFVAEASKFLGSAMISDFAKSNLPKLNAGIIERVIEDGLSARGNVGFIPLFNFLYADGHQMLTVGGVIGSNSERRLLRASKLEEQNYIRLDLKADPFLIRVPSITRKERFHLDSSMPCSATWKPKQFEMRAEDISDYREIYRFFPAYAELLL